MCGIEKITLKEEVRMEGQQTIYLCICIAGTKKDPTLVALLVCDTVSNT